MSCKKKHACGHDCNGFAGERQCLPCLKPECAVKAREEAKEAGNLENNSKILNEGIDEDSYCSICWISGLGSEPCVRAECGHIFHLNCIKTIIGNKWSTARI